MPRKKFWISSKKESGFSAEECEFKRQFKSMRRSNKDAAKKNWEDILDLFSWGVDLNVSQAQARDRNCIATQPVKYRQRLNAAIDSLEASDNIEDDDENWEDGDEYDPFDLEVP